ncbi:hypothetical protein HELRODRAFT_74190 [Helobdella robusta]|uniref:Tubulin--tyrosine ligase-like protein 9 n=1 Tax=Helobdella robusta TaxID=6412 RepID=T1G1N5_HELRO|nr:hypothetical protein HELRODRAFT_74190 [Helobdella robusta]ESO08908.1 hypothetical protein HELRODRAFT_74190 [Helobdella robusta]
MRELGWLPLADKYALNFKMKWVESRLSVNYDKFREGEQLVNRIPNCYMLTNKLGLLVNLNKYQIDSQARPNPECPKIKLVDFLPETYRIDDNKDRLFFVNRFKAGELWISKPIGLNQGRGIYLVRDAEMYREPFAEAERDKSGRLIQKYITNPLLIEGRKFDIRVYMLVACMKPHLVLFRKGYIRLCLNKYDEAAEDLTVHLTNQFIQRKCPFYEVCKNETIWSFDKFNDYINKTVVANKGGVEIDWVYKTLWTKMKNIALFTYLSVKEKLQAKIGYFDLYGLDFLIDNDLKVWLLEVNVNPCLATNCDYLKLIIPEIVHETISIALECFEKVRERSPLLPLMNLKSFEVLYHQPTLVFPVLFDVLSVNVGRVVLFLNS